MRFRTVLLLVALLLAIAGPARAQDPFAWATAHASTVFGSFVTECTDVSPNGKPGVTPTVKQCPRTEFAGIRIADSFTVSRRIKGFVRVDLFSRARAGQTQAPPTIPTTVAALQDYSSGAAYLGAYYSLNERVSWQCVGGVMFAMPSISMSSVGTPADATKYVMACGPRVGQGDTHVAIMGGHVGPVVEGDTLLGFLPSLVIEARVPLREWLAFTPDVSIGRDRVTKSTVFAARLALSASLGRVAQ